MIEKVELYLDECFSCHREKYQPLMQWMLDNEIPMHKFEARRVALNVDWQTFVRNSKMNLPFVRIWKDGKMELKSMEEIYQKTDFEEKQVEVVQMVRKKRQTKKKIAVIEAEDSINTSIEVKKDD